MKKTLLLTIAALALTASFAAAQGINLSLNDCGAAGSTEFPNVCTSNSGPPITMIASVMAPAGVNHMVAIEGVLDAKTSGAVLSPWWVLDGCRQGAMVLDANFTTGPFSCADYWGGQGTIVGGIDPIHSSPNKFRIKVACALPSEQAISMDETYLFKCSILRIKTVGTGACPGCADAASFVLNEIRLDQSAGAGDVRIFTPAGRSYITYNGGVANTPGAVPTQNHTWGQVKAQYR